MTIHSVETLFDHLRGALTVTGDLVTVTDETHLREKMDDLIYTAVFGDGLVRELARWLIWEAAQELGCRPASIHDFYIAGGRGLWHNQTTPAINVRALTYDTELDEAVKIGLISFSSTMRSNLAVGLPIDLITARSGESRAKLLHRIDDHDAYYRDLNDRWSAALRAAQASIPRPPYG